MFGYTKCAARVHNAANCTASQCGYGNVLRAIRCGPSSRMRDSIGALVGDDDRCRDLVSNGVYRYTVSCFR